MAEISRIVASPCADEELRARRKRVLLKLIRMLGSDAGDRFSSSRSIRYSHKAVWTSELTTIQVNVFPMVDEDSTQAVWPMPEAENSDLEIATIEPSTSPSQLQDRRDTLYSRTPLSLVASFGRLDEETALHRLIAGCLGACPTPIPVKGSEAAAKVLRASKVPKSADSEMDTLVQSLSSLAGNALPRVSAVTHDGHNADSVVVSALFFDRQVSEPVAPTHGPWKKFKSAISGSGEKGTEESVEVEAIDPSDPCSPLKLIRKCSEGTILDEADHLTAMFRAGAELDEDNYTLLWRMLQLFPTSEVGLLAFVMSHQPSPCRVLICSLCLRISLIPCPLIGGSGLACLNTTCSHCQWRVSTRIVETTASLGSAKKCHPASKGPKTRGSCSIAFKLAATM